MFLALKLMTVLKWKNLKISVLNS